jgi:Tfp pilus assembly protein PilF
MNDNNWRGAYLRGKDAVTITDGDWEAHLTVAEAARKLGKLDEAQKEYRRTLELDPLPKGRKEAETALKEMGGSSGDSLLP